MRRPDPEFGAIGAVADGVRGVIGHTLVAQRAEHRVVEFGGARDIGDADGNMMEHGVSLIVRMVRTTETSTATRRVKGKAMTV